MDVDPLGRLHGSATESSLSARLYYRSRRAGLLIFDALSNSAIPPDHVARGQYGTRTPSQSSRTSRRRPIQRVLGMLNVASLGEARCGCGRRPGAGHAVEVMDAAATVAAVREQKSNNVNAGPRRAGRAERGFNRRRSPLVMSLASIIDTCSCPQRRGALAPAPL